MNQILSVEMSNNRKRKASKKASIKTVVTFFCIILILFGVCIITIGVFSKTKENTSENVASSGGNDSSSNISKPNIEIIQGTKTLSITVTSDTQIDNIIYKWNNNSEEAIQVNGNGKKTVELDINIPVGTNTLNIVAKDINGVESEYTKEYVGVESYEPTVTLEQNGNTIIVKCSSEKTINYISYILDSDAEKTQQVNDITAEISLDAVEGEHKLSIVVVNEDGEKYEDTKSLYVPTASVVTDGTQFIINAEDTRGITKVSINFNGEEQEIEVNDTKYQTNLTLQDGENKIILVVYNSDGLSITKRVRFEK